MKLLAKRIFAYIAVLITIILSSCNNTLDKTFQRDSLKEDLTEIKENNYLDSPDLMLLGLYIAMIEIKGESPEGKSYREILREAKHYKEKERAWNKEQKQMLKQEENKSRLKLDILKKQLNVHLEKKEFKQKGWLESLDYTLILTNKSDKEIKTIKGTVILTDFFGNKLKSFSLFCNDIIPVGESHKLIAETDYNSLLSEDNFVKEEPLERINILWKPERIIFVDNSTL